MAPEEKGERHVSIIKSRPFSFPLPLWKPFGDSENEIHLTFGGDHGSPFVWLLLRTLYQIITFTFDGVLPVCVTSIGYHIRSAHLSATEMNRYRHSEERRIESGIPCRLAFAIHLLLYIIYINLNLTRHRSLGLGNTFLKGVHFKGSSIRSFQ